MKLIFTIAAAASGLALTGCVVTSVYPFYTEKDLVFEPRLLGTWKQVKDSDNKESWTFSRADANSYRVLGTDGASTKAYVGHLFKLDGQLLLDVCPEERHDDFIPPHYLVKVLQVEPTLRISLFSQDWLEKQLAAEPESVRHLNVKAPKRDEDRTVLTDSPQNLQAFVKKHLKSADAWGEVDELTRPPAAR